MSRVPTWVAVLAGVLAIVALSLPEDSWARAGSGGSLGSRGSRTSSSPSRTYSSPSSSTSAQPFAQPRPAPAPAPAPMAQPAPAGGFWRSMAGGVMGGLLGGMLFRSLGFAGGPGGMGGGGFGMMDLLLLAGIAYLIFWFIRRSRARQEEAVAGGYYERSAVDSYGAGGGSAATLEAPAGAREADLAKGLGHLRQLDPGFDEAAFRESCTDLFFRIQAAWMRQDMEALRPILTEEMLAAFREQLRALQAKRVLNKLENITIRSIELTESWQEQGKDYITVRFLANLLDYTVERESGRIVEGSDSVPVKFEEYWTWVRPVGPNPWQLSAINQVD